MGNVNDEFISKRGEWYYLQTFNCNGRYLEQCFRTQELALHTCSAQFSYLPQLVPGKWRALEG